jgi:hypothetical protein
MEMDSTTVILPKHTGTVDRRQHPDLPRQLPPGEGGCEEASRKEACGEEVQGQEVSGARRDIFKETHMPAKIIQRNKKSMKKVKVDTVTIDIIESALRNARYEMDTVLFRTAMSPGIREQHDEFPMIANLEGKMVVGQFGSSSGASCRATTARSRRATSS